MDDRQLFDVDTIEAQEIVLDMWRKGFISYDSMIENLDRIAAW
jgi:hypothetical protein